MFLNLPSEIILKISRYLSHRGKYQLMLTCSGFKDIILHGSLYEELTINRRNKSIFQQFESMEINGNQVKNLEVDMDELSNHQISMLPAVFPNVVKFYDPSMTGMKIQKDDDFTNWLGWKDRLTYYSSENFSHSRITYLLEKHTFPCLTNLSLTNFYEEQNGMRVLNLNIVDCVSHAPSLEILSLENCEINISFFEGLHASCPDLLELRLEDALISTSGESLPQPIVPAATLKYFQIAFGVVLCDASCIFLDYIRAKYPNLDALYIESSLREGDLESFQENLYLSGPGAQTLTVSEQIATQRDDFMAARRGYLHSGSRFLLQLPGSLETLALNVTFFNDVLESLMKTQINPKSLCFQGDIFQLADVFDSVNKFKYLRRLTSLKSLEVVLNCDLQEYVEDYASNSLECLRTTIVINPNNEIMDVAWILSAFPSLKRLSIYKSDAVLIGSQSDTQRTYPGLEFLNFDGCIAHQSAWSYFGNTAPNLRELFFHVYLESNGIPVRLYSTMLENDQRHYTFDLSNYRLDFFWLSITLLEDEDDGKHSLDFEVIIQNEIIKTGLIFSRTQGSSDIQYRQVANEAQDPSSIIPKFTFILDHRIKIKVGHLILLNRS